MTLSLGSCVKLFPASHQHEHAAPLLLNGGFYGAESFTSATGRLSEA